MVWFRADLRTSDNTALAAACNAADDVLAVFVLSPGEWIAHDTAPVKLDLIRRTLTEFSASLNALNIPLLFIRCETPAAIPSSLLQLAHTHGCTSLHFNREYEVNEASRDQATIAAFERAGLNATGHDDQTVLTPGSVLTQADKPFTVFTPFKKRWMQVLEKHGRCPPLPVPTKRQSRPCASDPIPQPKDFEISCSLSQRVALANAAELWPSGERHSQDRLARFAANRIERYKSDRDFPAIDGTSTISPYLAIGTISPRQCLHAALAANDFKPDAGKPGPAHWISEIVWREFYIHLIAAFPGLCKHRPFKPATDQIPWVQDESLFARWCEGRTGVPIVDAAMRQLVQTGWMHNRCRMIVAMYLTKDYFIDWRLGERFFMRHLVDGHLASNNGGWQWSASTGTDAAPYFRIYNPVSQSRTYDPNGEYIRRYCPELASIDDESIHDLTELAPLARTRLDYPEVAVDHAEARDRVMREFKAIA
jgi:deoxyribodipyrimidine photo-lyase